MSNSKGPAKVIKRTIKGLFRAVGLNISKLSNKHSDPPSALQHHKIELIYDIGANTGQYAMNARREGYNAQIVSFEPLPEAHAQLLINAKDDPHWIIHKRVALGASKGSAMINVSKNSYSSSILPMLSTHSSAAPESIYVAQVETEVATLDSIFNQYRTKNEKTFLKIDTQGFETEVLKGAKESLPSITGVQLELSIVPLYEGQDLYRYFLDFFEQRGFVLWSILPAFGDSKTGQLLQFDAIFIRLD
jgi:FkbM family methyltransferase